VRSLLPRSWRSKFAHTYLVEILTVILGFSTAGFGASILIMTPAYRPIVSFQQAFRWVAPEWWGLTMVVLGVLAVALLIHSRAAAAIPIFLLGMVWVAWVIPIVLSPGFVPSAPIVYGALSAVTLAVGYACLVGREERP